MMSESLTMKGILLFWPSFLIANWPPVYFFSIFDPAELTLHGNVAASCQVGSVTSFS
jgi:hypothetical protein